FPVLLIYFFLSIWLHGQEQLTVTTMAIKVVPLDVAWDSFDDQYQGCGPALNAKWSSLYNSKSQKNRPFAWGWYHADAEWRKWGSPVSPVTTHWQAVALMEYQNNLCFKTLHFLLTQALVTLRQGQNRQCHHVFWGMRDVHFQAWQGQSIRFGQFTSMWLRKEIALHFGTDTIFEVHTCHGVDIQWFSMYPGEEEVLIPPYETFEVTKVTQNGKRTWISLRSPRVSIPGSAAGHPQAWQQPQREAGLGIPAIPSCSSLRIIILRSAFLQ
uniref:NAD(P)(+)--arginine ADP-ribosyltransferase n=1 Tax=Zonotrichia albicollis TaxID=44394 RepID=A0A8D2MDF4_ZONAL